ncbi:oligosaccharyltransferase complex subunit ostc [Pyrus ussuriensis x Pyrus communis]|uniref:Oligosaccharyltransferase complex subunit ostc n=1 Tax=Pyrus ussuriensis x Pyrus communis TaxID=2448454 RepID=A0A5N5FB28_9ROSA|nr:oligosaccharyltransferase complex subunit ostc [Pyrus ussuriensis x Pyrus communis]
MPPKSETLNPSTSIDPILLILGFSPLQLPPRAPTPPQAPNHNPPLTLDRLRPCPPPLLSWSSWHCLRRHNRAPGHRINSGPPSSPTGSTGST